MELALALWLLYALHCVAWLPRGSVLFVRALGGLGTVRGPGWRMLPPLPSAEAVTAARLPVCEHGGSLAGRGGATWRAGQTGSPAAWPITTADLASARADGRMVRIGRRPLARAGHPDEAAQIAARLRALAADGGGGAIGALADWARERLAHEVFAARHARARREARWLGWSADVYAIALLIGLPVVLAWLGDERGLRVAAPVLAALHVATLSALALAHRRLRPGRLGERVETLLSALVYPPGLLRAHHALVAGAIGPFDPAAVGGTLLAEPGRSRLLRAELVRARRDAAAGSIGLARAELDALRACLGSLGLDEGRLLSAPSRSDALAESYCTACLCEYRRAEGDCADCGTSLVAYGR